MLNWANPGSLSDWTSFERHYVDALKFGQKRNCSNLQLAKVPALSLHLVLSPPHCHVAGRKVSSSCPSTCLIPCTLVSWVNSMVPDSLSD